MQLARSEWQATSNIEKVLKEPPFNTEEGKQVLVKILKNPIQPFTSMTEALKFGGLLSMMKQSPAVKKEVLLGICLHLLGDQDAKNHLLKYLETDDLFLQCDHIDKLDETGKLALATALQVMTKKQKLKVEGFAGDPATTFIQSMIDKQRLSKLVLSTNSEVLDAKSWQQLIDVISHPNLIKVALVCSNLAKQPEDNWQKLCDFVATTGLNTLGLRGNELNNIPPDKLQKLFEAVAKSKLKGLDLANNDLLTLSHHSWHSLFQAIIASPLIYLGLGKNCISLLPKEWWHSFCDMVKRSKLKSLSFKNSDSSLPTDEESWQLFSTLLREGPLTHLGLKDMWPHWDSEKWQKLFTAIASSQLHYLELADCEMTDKEDLDKFAEQLEENYQLQIYIITNEHNDSPALNAIILRNSTIADAIDYSLQVLNHPQNALEIETLDRINVALTNLQKALKLIESKRSMHAQCIRTKLLKFVDDLNWLKAKMKYSQHCSWKTDQQRHEAIELQDIGKVLASITPKSDNFEYARIKNFGIVFEHCSNHDKPFLAFTRALATTIHDQIDVCRLKDRNLQFKFDSYLLVASGLHDKCKSEILSAESRLALTKYILLIDIRETCGNLLSVAPASSFLAGRVADLLKSFTDYSFVPNSLQEVMADARIEMLWNKVTESIASIPLDHRQQLVQQVNRLENGMSNVNSSNNKKQKTRFL